MTCCKENVESILGSDMPSNSLLETSGKRKKKFTGGNASKRHRDRVNIEFSNLAKLLPFSESVIAKLDKSSILRLAVSFIRAKSFFKDAERAFEKRINANTNNIKKEEPSPTQPITRLKEGTGVLAEIFSQALDGFLLVLTEDMKVLFVSESVRDYLGYCQAGIIHENFLQFVNPSDHAAVQASLMYRKNEVENNKLHSTHQQGYHERHGFNTDHVPKCFDNGFKRNIVIRRFVCRMKCAFSCSSRFYTAYRTFQFSGHLRRSTIQEGREQKHLNSLVVFAVPIPHSSSTSVEPVNEMMDRTTTSLRSPGGSMENSDFTSYYERFGSGFRIEPTLRPHIAPIPVSRTDHPEHQSTGAMTRVRSCSLSDMPPLDVRQREYIYISRDSQPCITKSFSGPCSNESRYSDYSDDSKCSPASSPNLLWKNRPPSPYVPQYYNKNEVTEQYRKVEEFCRERERNMRRSFTEKEYSAIRLRASPDAYESKINTELIKREAPWYADLRHTCTNVGDEYKNTTPHQPDFSPYRTMERTDRKRNIMSDKDANHHVCTVPPKRKKTQNGSKRYDFNISSLLGLDQKEGNILRNHKTITRDEEVDVCNIDEGSDLQTYKEILANVPSNLDLSYTRPPALLPQS